MTRLDSVICSSASSWEHSLMYNCFNFCLNFTTLKSNNGREQTFRIYKFWQNGEARRELIPDYVILEQYDMSSDLTLTILSQLAKKIKKLSPKHIDFRWIIAFLSWDFSIIMQSSSSLTTYLWWNLITNLLIFFNLLVKTICKIFSSS